MEEENSDDDDDLLLILLAWLHLIRRHRPKRPRLANTVLPAFPKLESDWARIYKHGDGRTFVLLMAESKLKGQTRSIRMERFLSWGQCFT